MSGIEPITMPKWGLSMAEGVLTRWEVDVGAAIAVGQEIMDIETDKIANAFESPVAGVLRRRVVDEGDTAPVGALLGVVSEQDVPDAAIDDFVRDFVESFEPAEEGEATTPAPEIIDAGGHRIRHLKAGPDAGAAILLIHGFGADMSTWMFNHAVLAENRPVHAIDLPGHGGSSKELADGSVDMFADAALGYMDAAGLEAAHLVGHSLGGAIAATIALKSPLRVASLTLIAPTGLGPEIAAEFIEGFVTQSRSRKLRPFIEMLVDDPATVTADMVGEVLKFKRLDGAQTALQTIVAANFSGHSQNLDLRDRLADIKAPVHIIWGQTDRIIPARHAEGLPAHIGISTLPRAGHIVHMEKAAEVNKVIVEVAK